ncbi:MAG: heme NO-binding domain-containing protein [Betaproteobacteria bacterium]|nr:heme NO-binding domain-containing protein [Betaproteobacteria bacterium]MBI2959868.1 heme NO-binding domain-containing protein [Betaproteobacteria bacterium]
MNGLVFIEIEKFAQSRLGDEAWREIVRLAGVPSRIYFRISDYADEEAVALLSALSARLKEPVAAVLESLGEFIVPDLIMMSRYWINPEWKTLDLIANTEQTVHQMLRSEGSYNSPPRLQCRKSGPHEVIVRYDSPRKMCALAKGIVSGLAKHYEERVAITEPTCMLRGDPACELIVKVTSPAP